MDKKAIEEAVIPALEALGAFLVEVSISADNDIEIVIEKDEGSISWDDCSAVDRLVHERFSQDEEDYSLTVSSAGLDRPLKTLRQLQKALGSKVDVRFRGGRRLIATLSAADEHSVTLAYTALEAVEGKKRKEKVEHCEPIALDQINSITPYIELD